MGADAPALAEVTLLGESAMATSTLTPERALRRPYRIDLRAVLSLLVTVAAVGGMLLYANSFAVTRPLLIFTRDLPAGAVLTAADLEVAQVRVDDDIYAAAVAGDELGAVLGSSLAEPAHAQQILVHAQLSERPRLARDQVALTIPVSAASAAGGQLREGDEVQVLLTRNGGKTEAETVVVLERVRVYDVGYDERAAIRTTSEQQTPGPLAWLTLIVTTEQARALAGARHGGELDVALLPPHAPVPPATPAASGR